MNNFIVGVLQDPTFDDVPYFVLLGWIGSFELVKNNNNKFDTAFGRGQQSQQ